MKTKIRRGNQFKYGCECDIRRCNRKFQLEYSEYEWLAAKGLVRHIECPSVVCKRVVHDSHSTNEDVIVIESKITNG